MLQLRRSLFQSPSRRPAGAAALAAGTALILAVVIGGIVQAGAVTVGYRDFAYNGAAASRATSLPEQSKLWFNDGSWWGGLFHSSTKGTAGSHFDIFKFDQATQTWTAPGTPTRIVDARDHTHADYLWDNVAKKLYVVSTKSPCTSSPPLPSPPCNDEVRVLRFSYNPGSTTLIGKYTLDFTAVLAGGNFPIGGPTTGGGANAITIAKDTKGELYVVWTRDDVSGANKTVNVYWAHSNSDADPNTATDESSWTLKAPFVPAGAEDLNQDNTAAVVSFGTSVGVYWTHKVASGNSFGYFSVHADGASDATWSALETVTSGVNAVENQANVKAGSDGSVYAVIKTGTSNQIQLFKRDTGGTWAAHNVSTSGNGNTRAQLVLDENQGLVYVLSSSGSISDGTIYVKTAPLSTLTFPTGKGATFIKSATDLAIDDVTLTKDRVSQATGLLAEASDHITFQFFHNFQALTDTDATPPVGSAAINGGAAFTASRSVTVAVPASDAGSGVALVRLASDATVDGGGVLSGTDATTFSWAPTVAWTLPPVDGLKTVYVQWADGAGNWSVPISTTITLDTTGPSGAVSIDGGAATTNSVNATLDVTATDAAGVSQVRIANAASVDGNGLLNDASAVTSAYAATKAWTLTGGADGPRTVYAQWQDGLGNWSSVQSDTISLVTGPPHGTVAINAGAVGTKSLAVTLSFPNSDTDIDRITISNNADMSGSQTYGTLGIAFSGTVPWTLAGPLTNSLTKAVYVTFHDLSNLTSDPAGPGLAYSATDTVLVDLTRPVMRAPITPRWQSGTGLSGNALPLHLGWRAASDTISGVAYYTIWVSRDGRAYTLVGVRPGPAINVLVAPGHSYRYRVAATDRAGNRSAFLYSIVIKPASYQDVSRAVIYRGTWRTARSTLFYGGTDHWSSARSATATLRFIGRSVAWVAPTGLTRGSARVYVDGRLITTVSLRTSTAAYRRIVFARTWGRSATHTIRIVVLGTAGHPRVDLDAFLIIR